MSEYFVRFANTKEYAENDAERGYSFVAYALFDSPQDVAEFFDLVEYEVAEYGDNPLYYSGRNLTAIAPLDPDETQWGLMLNGLCGFGPFDTFEEAKAFAQEQRGYNGVEWPMAAIFCGHIVQEDRVDDGDVFIPYELIDVIDLSQQQIGGNHNDSHNR